MRWFAIAAVTVVLLVDLRVGQMEGAQAPVELSPRSPEADASVRAVKDAVSTFFSNWKEQRATRNATLFLSPDTPVTGIAPDHRPGRPTVVWHKKAGELLKEWEATPPKHLELDRVEVELFENSLAVARVTYRGDAIKGRAIFTLSSSAHGWRIASLVLETRFNW
jgi:hypothetical protein